MQAWRVHEFGEPADTFVLDDVPPPTAEGLAGLAMTLGGWMPAGPDDAPFDDWVLMRMRAAALALPDVTMSRGTYPVPVGRPYISGQEGVGIVEDASAGRRGLIGRRVVACTIQPWGSLAPLAVGVGMIIEVPDAMSDDAAAGYLIAAHTGYHAAIRRGQVSQGETVAVLGAAGGLGTAILQLCAAQGARVIAIVGGATKVTFCQGLGVEAVDHTCTDWVDQVKALTKDDGVQVIVDPVQGHLGAAARAFLAPNGRHVLCGHAGGLIPHDPDFYLYNHTLVGVDLGGYPGPVMHAYHLEAQAALSRLMDLGLYAPQVHRTVEFAEVPQAVTDLAERRTIGRVVVRIPQSA